MWRFQLLGTLREGNMPYDNWDVEILSQRLVKEDYPLIIINIVPYVDNIWILSNSNFMCPAFFVHPPSGRSAPAARLSCLDLGSPFTKDLDGCATKIGDRRNHDKWCLKQQKASLIQQKWGEHDQPYGISWSKTRHLTAQKCGFTSRSFEVSFPVQENLPTPEISSKQCQIEW